MARMPASGVRRSWDTHATSSRRLSSAAAACSRVSASRARAASSSPASAHQLARPARAVRRPGRGRRTGAAVADRARPGRPGAGWPRPPARPRPRAVDQPDGARGDGDDEQGPQVVGGDEHGRWPCQQGDGDGQHRGEGGDAGLHGQPMAWRSDPQEQRRRRRAASRRRHRAQPSRTRRRQAPMLASAASTADGQPPSRPRPAGADGCGFTARTGSRRPTPCTRGGARPGRPRSSPAAGGRGR